MPGAPNRRARLWPSGWNVQSEGTASPTGGAGRLTRRAPWPAARRPRPARPARAFGDLEAGLGANPEPEGRVWWRRRAERDDIGVAAPAGGPYSPASW